MLIQSAHTLTPRPPLRAVRLAKGLSLRKAAALAEIDAGHLSKVERGEKQLSIEAMHRLAKVLGLTEFAGMLALYIPDREAS